MPDFTHFGKRLQATVQGPSSQPRRGQRAEKSGSRGSQNMQHRESERRGLHREYAAWNAGRFPLSLQHVHVVKCLRPRKESWRRAEGTVLNLHTGLRTAHIPHTQSRNGCISVRLRTVSRQKHTEYSVVQCCALHVGLLLPKFCHESGALVNGISAAIKGPQRAFLPSLHVRTQ